MIRWRHVAGLFLLAALLLGATVTRPSSSLTLANLTLTGRFLASDGTAAVPSIAAATIPDNGLFWSGAMRWSESGIDRMGINSAALSITSGLCYGWTNSATNSIDTKDTLLCRGAAGLIGFGGTTSAFPGLKRGGTTLTVRLADDSGDATIAAEQLNVNRISNEGSGYNAFVADANGATWNIKYLTELTTIAAAATTDTAIQIPINAVVFAVSTLVTTAIPTAATFTVIGTTSATAFNTAAVSTALGSTDVGTANTPYKNGAAQTIRITPNLSPATNAGRVRVTIHYYDITVPSS